MHIRHVMLWQFKNKNNKFNNNFKNKFTLDTFLIMLSVKHGGIKYQIRTLRKLLRNFLALVAKESLLIVETKMVFQSFILREIAPD